MWGLQWLLYHLFYFTIKLNSRNLIKKDRFSGTAKNTKTCVSLNLIGLIWGKQVSIRWYWKVCTRACCISSLAKQKPIFGCTDLLKWLNNFTLITLHDSKRAFHAKYTKWLRNEVNLKLRWFTLQNGAGFKNLEPNWHKNRTYNLSIFHFLLH